MCQCAVHNEQVCAGALVNWLPGLPSSKTCNARLAHTNDKIKQYPSLLPVSSPQTHQLTMLSHITKRAVSVRAFSNTARVSMAVPPPSSADAFSDREKAQEAAYIRKHEAEQLAKLKEELAKQKESIEKLEQAINKK